MCEKEKPLLKFVVTKEIFIPAEMQNLIPTFLKFFGSAFSEMESEVAKPMAEPQPEPMPQPEASVAS